VAELRCLDGSVLDVRPVPVVDRDGAPYEATLELHRDGAPFGAVGERCGYFLTAAADRVRASDDLPASSVETGVRSWALAEGSDPDRIWSSLQRHLPRDRELFCFRSRDPDDLGTTGELRVCLEEQRTWVPGSPGAWQIDCRAVLSAWGAGGVGVRAVLERDDLLAFLDALVGELRAAGATYDESPVR
jgi:hypothetical protein